MKELLDGFWRAAAYCLHPRIILLSLLPLAIAAGVILLLGWLYWKEAVAAVSAGLEAWSFVAQAFDWLASVFGGDLRTFVAPVLVLAVAVPLVVVASLLLVANLMTPAVVNLVASRRFPLLERKQGASFLQSIAWSLGCTVVALVALVLSMPLWLIPPLVLLLPPLIWGWLTYRVMSFDSLADHASRDERRELLREHRLPLLGIGVITGYLGAAPSLLWAFGVISVVLAPILVVAAIWLYTLVFAFSVLWFTHYVLAALQSLRASKAVEAVEVMPVVQPLPPPIEVRPPAPIPPV